MAHIRLPSEEFIIQCINNFQVAVIRWHRFINEYFLGVSKPFIVRVLAWRTLIRVSVVKQAIDRDMSLVVKYARCLAPNVGMACSVGYLVSSEVRGEVGYRLPVP